MTARERWLGPFALDLRSLALFRVALGLVLVADLASDFADAGALYTRAGLLPRTLWAQLYETTAMWSFFLFNDSIGYARALLAVQLVLAGMLVVGYRTRLATVLSWVLFVSMLNRNVVATDGGDQIAGYLLFAGMFLPLGARASVDRLIEGGPDAATGFAGMGSVLLVSQMALMYVFAGLAKLMTTAWWSGEAMDVVLRWTEYTRPLADVFRRAPHLTRAMTLVVPWLECLLPVFFVLGGRRGRLRCAAVVTFAAMHVAIDLSLRLTFFSLYSVAGLAALLPSGVWGRAGAIAFPKPTGAVRWLYRAALVVAGCSAYSAVPALLGEERIPYPVWVETVNDVTFGYQNWNLFRDPVRTSGWYRAKATLQDGRIVDLLQAGAPYTEERPRVTCDQFPSRRWLSFMMRAHANWDDSSLRWGVARTLVDRWNAAHDAADQSTGVVLFYFREDHRPFFPSELVDSYEYARFDTAENAPVSN